MDIHQITTLHHKPTIAESLVRGGFIFNAQHVWLGQGIHYPGRLSEFLVGGFNPFKKYARQNGSFPQIGVKIKIFETTP